MTIHPWISSDGLDGAIWSTLSHTAPRTRTLARENIYLLDGRWLLGMNQTVSGEASVATS